MPGSRYPREEIGPERNERGFTLLELLAGIALFALLSSFVLVGLRLGVRSWDAAAEKSAESEQMRVVSEFLRRQLSGSLALATGNGGRWALQFEGTSKSLEFVSEFPDYVASGGAQRVALQAERDGGEKRLLMKWWPLHSSQDAAPLDQAVLLRNLARFEISYYGAFERGGLSQWRDDWQGIRYLPELVKISITDAGSVPWPPLVVPLRVNGVRFYKSSYDLPEGAESLKPVVTLPTS